MGDGAEFPEIETVYTEQQAKDEAARCYRCDVETGTALSHDGRWFVAQFNVDGRPSRGLRLSIGSVNEAEIGEGAKRLGRVIRERLAADATSTRGQVHI